MEQGGPIPEPVAIQRTCGTQVRREAYTDSKGGFSFMFGDNMGILPDASENVPIRPSSSFTRVTTAQLWNCELRAVLPGYISNVISLAGRQLTDIGDVGTFVLHKTSTGEGDSISVISLQAPDNARKAYQKAREAYDKNKLQDVEKQTTKAIEIYPKYAAALDLRGRAMEKLNRRDDAARDYQSAIDADKKFVLPYLRLATLLAFKNDWPQVLKLTDEAVRLDPGGYPFAYYLQAAANLNTGNINEAERGALKAVSLDKDHRYPRTELLAGIVLQTKGEHAKAVPHFQNFLKMAPNSAEAPDIRKYLVQQNAAVTPPEVPKH